MGSVALAINKEIIYGPNLWVMKTRPHGSYTLYACVTQVWAQVTVINQLNRKLV